MQNNPSYTLFSSEPLVFGKFYFPHHFRDRSPYFHWIIISESYKHAFFACEAPRGSAKSTVLSFLKAEQRIAFKHKRFIDIVKNTYKKAAGTLRSFTDKV